MNLDYFQMIPLLTLAMYFLYLTYYYAAPMFWLKVLLFAAHIRYRDIDILFSDGRVTVRYRSEGEERILERPVEADPTSRFFAMTVCSATRGVLRDLRNGAFVTERKAAEEFPADKEPSDTESGQQEKFE